MVDEVGRADIARLNGRLRRTGEGGRILITRGIAALDELDRDAIIQAVQEFSDFNEDNDPHGEHDCAVLQVGEHRIIWKIDAYDLSLTMASPDAANEDETIRVLTVMLAWEY